MRDVFCGDAAPTVESLSDLQQSLGITAGPGVPVGLFGALPGGTVPVLQGISTALSGRLVSPINPRAILLGTEVIMAFQRGVQTVELATRDRAELRVNLYLITFEQECNARAEGCRPGDLYTPALEQGWRHVVLRDDEDLKNTALDCRQCHRRARDTSTLLMRELNGPWTHFFAPAQDQAFPDSAPGLTGTDLLLDYRRARGSEPLAGIGEEAMGLTTAFFLELAVESMQPLLFDAAKILDERYPSQARGGPGWPEEPNRSPTWDRGYAAFKRGEQLSLPHYMERPTDADKQARLTQAYQRYREGELSAEDLPDLSDIFPDDPLLRAEIGLDTAPDASPPEALIQACGSCHNDVLDQTISRARFNIALDRMDRAELDLAIERIGLPSDAQGVMPPPEARQLPPRVKADLVEYLRRDAFPEQDLAPLHHAAERGMAGGGQSP